LPFEIRGHLDITRRASSVRPLVKLANALGDQFQLAPLGPKHVVPLSQTISFSHLKLINFLTYRLICRVNRVREIRAARRAFSVCRSHLSVDPSVICPHLTRENAIILAMEIMANRPQMPAEYYRQQAARVRGIAQEATTRAVREHLAEVAQQYEQLADGALVMNHLSNRY